ncbi:hypothetical protein [Glaciibacter psychrotolerans]|uniref:Cytochrome c-type biogenesis protein CcmH/NrfG n=1 Tax=Glaciibacter psychrotolerans TaxID=670054 RepID=A0A7Z0EED7_9MICO|nr:hypothetical protein [Leifsonia psychrotolerans]NYJ19936.1 cytochrome c-type biogenesis protein CcmH/NrfG [Leifsonia psychrotolerans]
MKGRVAALFMSVLLLLYIVLVGWRAVLFIGTGEPVAVGIGVALLVLPLIGIWALVREVQFGLRTERLVKMLDAAGALPAEELTVRASGRPVRDEADADFPRFQAEVDAAPNDWASWFRLGLAYDAAGDRKRARQAIRTAISLEQAKRRAA